MLLSFESIVAIQRILCNKPTVELSNEKALLILTSFLSIIVLSCKTQKLYRNKVLFLLLLKIGMEEM